MVRDASLLLLGVPDVGCHGDRGWVLYPESPALVIAHERIAGHRNKARSLR